MSDGKQRVPAGPHIFFAGLFVALGLAAFGWLVAQGLQDFRSGERSVSVKGLAEREVEADLALWSLRFVATDDDLNAAQARLQADAGQVRAFLAEAGFAEQEVVVEDYQVTDLLAQQYRSGPVESRYILAQSLLVRSGDIAKVAAAAQNVGRLVDAGVVLSSENQPISGPVYLFTRLNDVKPEMIAEATASAREAAEQFARDAGSEVGPIRRANQGLFQILPRDDYPGAYEPKQPVKKLRVVTSMEYLLVD
ncbi:MAG: SIMPL domain-containing protein [Tistlia sp.]|uniref:SIMPL domain-containing protein n=1 Tax=Tistlia sp. TaxID=3057121 RepID=UPI0034A26B47